MGEENKVKCIYCGKEKKLFFDIYKYDEGYVCKLCKKAINEKRDIVEDISKRNEILNPKCPTCGSMNVEKISAGDKVGWTLLVGVAAIGYVAKTFRCNNCGYKW